MGRNLALLSISFGTAELGASDGPFSTYDPKATPSKVLFVKSSDTVAQSVDSVVVAVKLDKASPLEVRVNYSTIDNSTHAGEDYDAAAGTLIFTPGQTVRNIVVPIRPKHGEKRGANENFKIVLSNPVGGKLSSPATITIAIIDDHPLLALTATISQKVNENDYSAVMATIAYPAPGAVVQLNFIWGDGESDSDSGVIGTDGTLILRRFHRYRDDGPPGTPQDKYTASLKVTEPFGVYKEKSLPLTVVDVASTLSDVQLSPLDDNGDVTLTGPFSDPGTLDTFTLQINWGDKTAVQSVQLSAGATSFSETHRFARPWSKKGFQVALVIADKDGKKDDDKKNVEVVTIRADINRDGKVDDKDDIRDANGVADKVKYGTIVIANKNNVYADPKEPALRREIQLSNTIGKVRIKRNSENLKLYDAQIAGNEIAFGEENETIGLAVNKSYWLQGGDASSTNVQKDWLEVRPNIQNSIAQDKLTVTVVWVEISAINTGKLYPITIYGKRDYVVKLIDTDDLGLQRGPDKGTVDPRSVRAAMQTLGFVYPADIKHDSFKKTITSGIKDSGYDKNNNKRIQNAAEFGFLFRRFVTSKYYLNGNDIPYLEYEDRIDDAREAIMDLSPMLDKDEMSITFGKDLIFDADAPDATVASKVKQFFLSRRANYIQHVVFSYASLIPERCSKKLKTGLSIDIALNQSGRASYVINKANTNEGTNRYIVDAWCDSLNITYQFPAITFAVENKTKLKKIKRNTDVYVTIAGTDLVGSVFLRKKDKADIAAVTIRVTENDPNDKCNRSPLQNWRS